MRRHWPLLVIVLLSVVVWAPLWSGERTFFLRDFGPYFYPMKSLLADTVRAGEWPWWNPWIRNGLPFFANPETGLFYPPNALLYVLPLPFALNWFIVGHFALLGTGFFVWLRSRGMGRWPALVAGTAAMWGGFAMTSVTYLNNLQSLAWIGWIWWAWDRWCREGSPRWLAVSALGFGVQFLAGEPQITAITALLALGTMWMTDQGDRQERKRIRPSIGVASMGLVTVGAMLLVAVQLVPTVELFLLSGRSGGLALEESVSWSLAPLQVSNLVIPRYFDGSNGLFDLRSLLSPTKTWVLTAYVGGAVTVLAAGAMGSRRQRWTIGWGAVSALGIFLALGEHNPLYMALLELPTGLSFFRYPEKFLVLTAVGLPILAALGVEALFDEQPRSVVPSVVTATGIVSAAAVGWAFLDAEWVHGVISTWDEEAIASAEPRRIVEGLRRGFVHVGLFATASGLAVLTVGRVRRSISGILLTVVVLLDLMIVNLAAAPTIDSSFYTTPPEVLESLPTEELRLRTRTRTTPLGEHVVRFFTVPGMSLTSQQLYYKSTMGPNFSMLYRVLAQDGAEAFRPRQDDIQNEILSILPPDLQIRYLRLMSVGYLFERRLTMPGVERIMEREILGAHLYRVLDPLPRAYLVQRVEVVSDSLEVINRFVARGEDPHHVAFVPRAPGLDGPAQPVEGDITWLESSNHRVRLLAETPVSSFLVLVDSYYPGWEVYVDDEPRSLRRANWHFRGVMIPPGNHEVEFRYRPRGIRVAGAISAVSLVGLVLVIVFGGRVARRERS